MHPVRAQKARFPANLCGLMLQFSGCNYEMPARSFPETSFLIFPVEKYAETCLWLGECDNHWVRALPDEQCRALAYIRIRTRVAAHNALPKRKQVQFRRFFCIRSTAIRPQICPKL